MRFDEVELCVPDLEAARAFYAGVLQMPELPAEGGLGLPHPLRHRPLVPRPPRPGAKQRAVRVLLRQSPQHGHEPVGQVDDPLLPLLRVLVPGQGWSSPRKVDSL